MKKTTRNRKKKALRPRPKDFLYEVDMTPVYRKFDKRTQETVRVSYFNDWCVAQIGMTWDDAMESLLEFRYSFMAIEDYWRQLRKDFFEWAYANRISGWGVHMYPDKEQTARSRHTSPPWRD